MKKTYRSKVDIWLIVFIAAVFFLPGYLYLYVAFSALDFSIITILTVLCLIPLFSIKYVIDDEYLTIKLLYIFSSRFKIDDIKYIRPTNTLLSAPAASIDRLEIQFDKDTVIISPVKKDDFIKTLQELCSHEIEIKK